MYECTEFQSRNVKIVGHSGSTQGVLPGTGLYLKATMLPGTDVMSYLHI